MGRNQSKMWTKTHLAKGGRSLTVCIIVAFMALFSLYEGAKTGMKCVVSSTALVNENRLDFCFVLVTGVSQSMLFSRRLHIHWVNFHVYEGDSSSSWGLSREITFCKFRGKFCVSKCVAAILLNTNVKLLGFRTSRVHFKLEREKSGVPF